MNSWFFTWTLTRIICSESVLVARLAPSGAPGAPRRRDSPRYRPSVSESSSETQPRTWSVVEMNSVLCLRVESWLRGLHAEQQEEHGSAQRLGPVALPRHLLKHPFVLLWADADLQVIAHTHTHTCRTVCAFHSFVEGWKEKSFYCLCRISAAGQVDRRDSLGVCVDSRKGAESLQRDQAVCISTNGTLTHTP